MALTYSQLLIKINNEAIAFIPNSGVLTLGTGEQNIRATQLGASVQVVASENAETRIGKFKFDMVVTDLTISRVQAWKKKMGELAIELIFTEAGISLHSSEGAITNNVELTIGADNKTSIEYAGSEFL